MRNNFPKTPSGEPLHILSKFYYVFFGLALFVIVKRVAVTRHRIICLAVQEYKSDLTLLSFHFETCTRDLSLQIMLKGSRESYHIRYARACSSYECVILRAARLSSKLLGQGYVMERLKSSLRKFYGRYGDLIKHYEVSLSQMLHDILGHDHIQ